MGRDVTDRARAEHEVREHQSLLDGIVTAAQDCIFVKDASLRYLTVNPATARLLGLTQDSIVGKSDVDLYGEEEAAEIAAIDRRVLQGETIDQVLEKTLPAGRYIFHGIKSPLRDHTGRIIGICGIARDITEQKRAEEQNRMQGGLIRSLLDSMSDLVFFKDVKSVYLGCNAAFAAHVGRDPEAIVGKTDYDLYDREEAEAFRENDRRVLETMVPRSNEEWIRYPDGRQVLLDTLKTPYRDSQGSVIGVLGICRDITARRTAEQALREREEKYRGLFDESVAAIYIFDAAKNFVDANKAGLDLLGYSREELLSMRIPDVDADPVVVLTAHDELLSGARLVNYEHSLRRKDGSIVTVLNNSKPLTDAGGAVVGMLSTLVDVTDRKKTEQALRESEERFRSLVENMQEIICSLDEDGRIIYVSPNIQRVCGYARTEVEGTHFSKWIHADDLNLCMKTFHGEPTGQAERVEFRFRTRDGGHVWFSTAATRVFRDGRWTELQGVLTDITERKRMELLLQVERDFAFSLSVTDSLDDALAACLEAALRVSELDAGGVYLVNPETGAIELRGHRGLSEAFLRATAHFSPDSPQARLIAAGHPLYVRHSEMGVQMNGEREAEALKAVAIVPISHHGAVLGCLNIASHTCDDIPEHAREVLEILAGHMGRSIAHQLTKEALRESETRFRSITENAFDLISVIDLEGRYTYCNGRFFDILGYSPQEVVGRSCFELVHAEDRETVATVFFDALAEDKEEGTLETRTLCRDGAFVWVENRARLIRDTVGNPAHIYIHGRDVTERKRAEFALRESEAKFRTFAELAPVGIVISDGDEKTLYASPKFVEMFGYTQDEMVSVRQWFSLAYPDANLREHVKERWTLAMTKARREGVEIEPLCFPVTCKNGAVRHVEFRGASMGDLNAIVAVDISERIRFEEELKASEARLSLALQVARMGYWRYACATGRVEWFSGHDALFGISMEDFGETLEAVQNCVHPDDRQHGEDNLRNTLEERVPFENEYRVIHPDGSVHWLRSYGKLFEEGGRPDHIFGITQDITEHKIAETERERVNALLEAALAQSPSGILVADAPDVSIRWANAAALSIRGQSDAPLSGIRVEDHATRWQTYRPDGSVYPSEDLPLSRAILRGEITRNEEVIIRHDSGEERWVSANAAPIRDTNGNITAGIVIFHDITEQKRASEALRLQALVLDQIQDLVTVTDLDGRITYVNQAEVDSLGYSREELIGDSTEKYGDDPERGARQAEILEQTLRVGHWRGEVVNRRGDGSEIILDCRTQVVHDEQDRAVALCGIATDITERTIMERVLRESEERFRVLVEDAPFGLSLMRGDRRFVYFNQQFTAIFGYTLEDLPDKAAWFLRAYPDPEYRARVTGIWTADFKDGDYDPGAILDREFVVCCKNGESKSIHFRTVNLADGSQILCYEDVTERRETEAERERLLRAIEQAGESIVIADTNGIIRYVNPAFTMATGYAREEAVGQNPRILKSGQQDAEFYRALWELLLRGEVWRGRMVNKRKDGGLIVEDVIISPVHDATGRIVNYVGVKRDVTEAVHLEEQLRQSQKMESIGRLAGGVAHDFNNMLGAILGYAELALDKAERDTPIYADLEEIQRAAERSADLTRQLLAFARKQTVEPRVLDLNQTVDGMLNMLQRLIGEHIELRWTPGAGVCSINMDPSQLDQILVNLCVNARDAMEETGTITIETGVICLDDARGSEFAELAPGEYALLTVCDTGSGMDKETLEHLFDPFFTTKESGKGSGLGLSTVYGAVKQNNGLIRVQSEPGRGTTFSIYFPGHATGLVSAVQSVSVPVEKGGHATILLVEDEPAILKLAMVMVENMGHTVLAASAPGEAMRMAREHAGVIDLLMTDVVMPEMNGRDLARNVQSLYPDVRCLFMSGYTADIIAHHGVLERGVHFIQKPFRAKDLAAKVLEALEE